MSPPFPVTQLLNMNRLVQDLGKSAKNRVDVNLKTGNPTGWF